MVKFVAQVAVNTQKLTELGLLSDFTDMKLTNRSSTTITAKDKDAGVNFEMTGSGFLYNGKNPYAGIVKTIDVVVSGDSHYTLSGLSIPINKMDSYFSGSINKLMQKIFDETDKLVGSNAGDVLYSYDMKDKVNGKGGDDLINGGKGNDTLVGSSGNDTLFGSNGGDNLNGSAGNDSLNGGKGSDTLDGGGGTDTLTGGGGFDTFVFDNALGNIDTITDMTAGGDAIDLAKSIFTALPAKGVLKANAFEIGSAATSSSVRIVYDSSNGNLYYDPDGNGGQAQTQFAALSTGLALSNTDFFVI